MGLKSFFQRKDDAPREQAPRPKGRRSTGAGEASDAVQQARTRARRRLTGAVVLLGIGIIGFPLLFETQPRPLPVDIPIEIPNKDTAAPLVLPPTPRPHADAASSAVAAGAASSASAPVIEETAADAGREVASPPAPASAVAAAPAVPASHAAPAHRAAASAAEKSKLADKPTDKPAKEAAAAPKDSAGKKAGDDGSRAKALLEGKPSDASGAAAGGRFIVQVGAFAERSAAHEARLKVEKLGLKTYTQVVDTAGGQRIRVRVGPFASKDEATQAAAKLKAAGLSAAVLTL
jgi:DedD protein